MQSGDIPVKFPVPFANGAGNGYVRPIPTPSQIALTPGAASLTDGFPPDTFSPVAGGGVPPFGQDMNGILKQITAWSRWQQAGGPMYYDAGFSASIGGYPYGAVLWAPPLTNMWLSVVDNNTSNPDAGGAGWRKIAYGPTVVTSFNTRTGGVVLSYADVVAALGYVPVITGTAHQVNLGWDANSKLECYIDQTVYVGNVAFEGWVTSRGYLTSAVTTFNGRANAVTLNASDVINALGYTPVIQGNANTLNFYWDTALELVVNGGYQGRIATQGWVNSVTPIFTNASGYGYMTFPSGLIVAWGYAQIPAGATSTGTMAMPVTFPHGTFSAVVSDAGNGLTPYGIEVVDNGHVIIQTPLYQCANGNIVLRGNAGCNYWVIGN